MMMATKLKIGDRVRVKTTARERHWVALQERSRQDRFAGCAGTVRREWEDGTFQVQLDGWDENGQCAYSADDLDVI